MQTQYEVAESCLIIKVPQELDHHYADIMRTEVELLLQIHRTRNLVFDFEETEFMDSSGIGIIAGRYKKIQCLNGKVFILNAGRQVNRILLLSGLQKYVVIMK